MLQVYTPPLVKTVNITVIVIVCHRQVRGLARILTSPEAFERMLQLMDSPHNGLTFCQGCFSSMGIDIPDAIRRVGHRAHFVHFRDVKGNATDGFLETWQDEGQTDMKAALEVMRQFAIV